MFRSVRRTATSSSPKATYPRRSHTAARRWFSAGTFLGITGVHLLPLLPAWLFDVRPPTPAIVITSSALLVLTALFVNEWLFRPRARFGVFPALAISVGVALALGTFGGMAGHVIAGYLKASAPPRAIPLPVVTLATSAMFGAVTSLFQVGFWAIAFVIPASVEEERIRLLEIQNLRLESNELRTQAELVRLRAQLEPHFLLNTLNLVAGLVTANPTMARDVLADLGELLTDGLGDERELGTVREELRWLQRYVGILTARYGDRLRVRWDLRGDVEHAHLPRLLLQPLIENAVRHGALRNRAGGQILIRIERQTRASGEALVCSVSDDGPGLGTPRDGAIGLDNVRRRLELSYPTSELVIRSDDGGTTAAVILPFSEEPPNAAEVRQART